MQNKASFWKGAIFGTVITGLSLWTTSYTLLNTTIENYDSQITYERSLHKRTEEELYKQQAITTITTQELQKEKDNNRYTAWLLELEKEKTNYLQKIKEIQSEKNKALIVHQANTVMSLARFNDMILTSTPRHKVSSQLIPLIDKEMSFLEIVAKLEPNFEIAPVRETFYKYITLTKPKNALIEWPSNQTYKTSLYANMSFANRITTYINLLARKEILDLKNTLQDDLEEGIYFISFSADSKKEFDKLSKKDQEVLLETRDNLKQSLQYSLDAQTTTKIMNMYKKMQE
jgi:hypothetical protein